MFENQEVEKEKTETRIEDTTFANHFRLKGM
jgi:hypothetical protein